MVKLINGTDIHIDFTNTETNEEEAVLSVPLTHVAPLQATSQK